ncbi:MAG: hypothetical protein JXX29_21230 [Deltaproteobacteria bacterium]|nr:hypothetical protein [Deltaproteobacteria bacterium]MBN2674219.1 hypothetical protein [Deltaproteobacteria bacterium]
MSHEIKPYVIVIYGKDGCDLCVRLKNEVSVGLIENKLDTGIGLDYQNLATQEGMVAYAVSETINGQRIPALQLMKFDHEKNTYCKIPDNRPERRNEATGELEVPVYLQLQTDYTAERPEIQWRQVQELIDMVQPTA